MVHYYALQLHIALQKIHEDFIWTSYDTVMEALDNRWEAEQALTLLVKEMHINRDLHDKIEHDYFLENFCPSGQNNWLQ